MKNDSLGTGPGHEQSSAGSVIRPVTVKLFVDESRFLRLIEDMQKIAEISEIKLEPPSNLYLSKEYCPVCRWIHNPEFTRIKTNRSEIQLFAGLLPQIVARVHRAHESGLQGLDTKDDELKMICCGYNNPCKAFDDLRQRAAYKELFFTRKRGLISLRAAIGMESK